VQIIFLLELELIISCCFDTMNFHLDHDRNSYGMHDDDSWIRIHHVSRAGT
jgi:hypothetical protein